MALSSISYTGTGAQTDYTFPFLYLDKTDVFVYVAGVIAPFTFINSSAIRCTTAPASGSTVTIKRITQKQSAPVNFTDGSVLLEVDLDTLAAWTLYGNQEASDAAATSLIVGPSGTFEAGNRRLSGLAAGVNGSDALTVDQASVYSVAAAGSATAAASAATRSSTSADASAGSATTSAAQATIATNKASEAANSAANAAATLANAVQRTSATGSALVPSGTTAQRDATPSYGAQRANSTLNQQEWWNGSAWVPMGGGATGAPGNSVFMENDQSVTASYTITAGKNAVSAGPISIADGVVVTIPTGSTWSIA